MPAISFVIDDPDLVSISTQSQLSATLVGAVLQSFPGASLIKVRGKVALIKSILAAIQREKRLSSTVDISDLAVEIYSLVYADPSVNSEPVDAAELTAIRSMVEYLLRHDLRRGLCRRFADGLCAFFR